MIGGQLGFSQTRQVIVDMQLVGDGNLCGIILDADYNNILSSLGHICLYHTGGEGYYLMGIIKFQPQYDVLVGEELGHSQQENLCPRK